MNRLRTLMGGDHQAALGLIVLGGLVVVTLAVFSGIPRKAYDNRGDTVKVVFPTTGVMSTKTRVRVNGVPVGKVKKMSLNPGGRSTTVELAVRKEGMPLYKDAQAHVKFSTLLGGNYTIDLDRGTPNKGKLDPLVIPESQTTTQVELDQILEPIRAGQRAGLKTMLHELPPALRDHAAPARALSRLADVSPVLTRGLGAARGEQVDRDLRALVRNTASTVRALDAPGDTVARLLNGAAGTLRTTAQREADIRATIANAARVMPAVRTTVQRLDHTLGLADPVVARLQAPAGNVAPTVSALRPTLVGADRLLRDARPLVRSLRPAITAVAGAARAGRPLLDELMPSLTRLDRQILPDLAKVDPVTHRATYEMLGPGVTALTGLGSSFDSVAGFAHLGLGGGERAVDSPPCHTYFTDPTAAQLVKCKAIGDALRDYLNYKPIPTGGSGG